MSNSKKSLSIVAAAAAIAGAVVFGPGVWREAQYVRADESVNAVRQALAGIDDQSALYRAIDRDVEPSVVEIRVTKSMAHEMTPLPPDFQKFFHDFGGGNQFPPEFFNGGGSVREVGMGSGVIMDASDGYGYILTNNHVAGGASQMTVTLSDGRVIQNAQLVGADPRTDLAVVKIKADDLIPAKWGDTPAWSRATRSWRLGAPLDTWDR